VSRGVQAFWKAVIDPTTHDVTWFGGPTIKNLEEIIDWIGIGTFDTRLSAYTNQHVTDFLGYHLLPNSWFGIPQLWHLLTIFGSGDPPIIRYP
jgi:hypothetical protein